DTPAWVPLPWSWAAERLLVKRNFWVVTVSADGRPQAPPVWGVWDDDSRRLALSCGPRARKARNLAANPRAVVVIDDTVECLSGEDHAAPVPGDERQAHWIERYLAKYQPLSPDITADFLRQNLMFVLVPERALAVIERAEECSTRATRGVFDT
ncbi:MAG: pyridoxamine 5'-phosphate oxidase family protein, partial [Acidimicrobiia bacterium]